MSSTLETKLAEKLNERRLVLLADSAAGQLENYINEPLRKVVVDYCQENNIIST